MKDDADLTKSKLNETIKKLAIPASIGLFFQALYNLTDAYYVGQLSTTALAGLAITFPVFFLIASLGSGAGIALNALRSKALGAGEMEKAAKLAGQGISFGVFLSIIVMIIGLATSNQIFSAISGTTDVAYNAIEYMNVIYYGLPLFFLVFLTNGLLNSIGDTKTNGIALVIGFFVNIGLDPAFMYGWFGLPAMGVAGVALATVITQVLTIAITIRPLLEKSIVSFRVENYIPNLNEWLEISGQSIPTTLGQASVSIGFLIVTKFVSDFGENAVATFGVGVRIDQLVVLPAIGIAIAVIPLIGQNYGAKKIDRVKEAYLTALKMATTFLTLGVLLVIVFAPQMAALFTNDSEVIKTTVEYLRITAFGYIAIAIFIISASALQGLGRAQHSLAINIMRVVVVMFPAIFFFAYFAGLKETGIWIGVVTSSFIVAVVSYWYVIHTIDKLKKLLPEKPAL